MTKSVTQLELEITGKIKGFDKKIGELDEKLDKLGNKSKKTSGFLSNLIPSKAMVGAAAASFAFATLGKAIGELMAREDALADFSAITGITGAKLQEFGTAAEDLSNKFGTGVIENIEAFKGVLSKLGPDFASSTDAVKAMGDNINTLSKASGLDAVASMDALTTAMLQFGVDLSDPVEASAEAARMMNVMAAGAKEGAAEIPQINEALKQVGITASELNISFEETNAAIQVLAAGGKTGSEAGVALRNVMVSLTKGTKISDAALAKIGLTTEQLGKVMTEQGLDEALRLFNSQLSKMPSLADQAALKAQVFGKENLAAAGKLIKSADAMDELTGKVTDTSVAYDQSAIKMATSSEKLNRAMNSAWNDIVSGLGKGGEFLASQFDEIFTSMEQTAGAFGKLLQLDIVGFWDQMTMSVSDYNKEKERQLQLEEKNYRLAMQQADADIKRTGQRKKLLDLQNELVTALKKTEGITDSNKLVEHMDKFKEMFNKGAIESVDEYFLALRGGADSSSASTGKATDALKDFQLSADRMDAAAKIASTAIASMNEQVLLQIKTIDEAQKKHSDFIKALSVAPPPPPPSPGAQKAAQEEEEMAKQWKEAFEQYEKRWSDMGEIAAVGSLGIAASMGSIFNAKGMGDAGKEMLKAVGGILIDMAQMFVLAAAASSVGKAVTTFGASLITDAPWLAAAYLGLEALQGFVGSFALGTPYVPKDMTARIHKGERVMNADENARYNAGKTSDGGNTGVLGRKRSVMDANVKIGFDSFARAGAYSEFAMARSVW